MLSLWVLLFYYDYLNFSVSTTWLNFQSENHLHMCLVCNNKIWYLFFFLIYEDFYDPVEEDEFEQDVKVHILFPTESLLVSSQLYLIYIWVLLHDAWIFYTLKKQSSIRFGITWHTIYIYNENIFTLDEFFTPLKKTKKHKIQFYFSYDLCNEIIFTLQFRLQWWTQESKKKSRTETQYIYRWVKSLG